MDTGAKFQPLTLKIFDCCNSLHNPPVHPSNLTSFVSNGVPGVCWRLYPVHLGWRQRTYSGQDARSLQILHRIFIFSISICIIPSAWRLPSFCILQSGQSLDAGCMSAWVCTTSCTYLRCHVLLCCATDRNQMHFTRSSPACVHRRALWRPPSSRPLRQMARAAWPHRARGRPCCAAAWQTAGRSLSRSSMAAAASGAIVPPGSPVTFTATTKPGQLCLL